MSPNAPAVPQVMRSARFESGEAFITLGPQPIHPKLGYHLVSWQLAQVQPFVRVAQCACIRGCMSFVAAAAHAGNFLDRTAGLVLQQACAYTFRSFSGVVSPSCAGLPKMDFENLCENTAVPSCRDNGGVTSNSRMPSAQ